METTAKGELQFGQPLTLRWIRKDGTIIWTEQRNVPVYDSEGRLVAIEGIARNVTERVEFEAALSRERLLLRTVIDNLPYTIYAKNLEGRKILTNPTDMAFMGVTSEDEVLGKRDSEIYPPELARQLEADDRRVQETREPILDRETQLLHPVLGEVWLQNSKLPLVDESDKVLGIVGLVIDITERKKAEEQQLEMERHLLHTQRLESLGMLAGGIAHDFNNLLMAILGNLDLAMLDLSPLSPARDSIMQAMQASRRAADVTRQMLAYSGKGRFFIQDVNLSELVKENAHMLRAAIAGGVTLNLQVNEAIPPVRADPGQLQQVIINLITNASEAIGQGQGVVRLSTGVTQCDTAYLSKSCLPQKPPAGEYVYLEVEDTACGMDEETLERLFEPFFTSKSTGRGLGMAAIQGIITGHEGAILVDSTVGRGTVIRVLLPFVTEANPQTDGTSATPGLEKDQLRPSDSKALGTVMVVDDEPMVRRLSESMLRHLGYHTLMAENGQEALDIYQAHCEDIIAVLMDLTMPQMDGLTAARALLEIDPQVPIVLCSGYSQQESDQEFAALGVAGFIQKPYDVAMLQSVLAQALANND